MRSKRYAQSMNLFEDPEFQEDPNQEIKDNLGLKPGSLPFITNIELSVGGSESGFYGTYEEAQNATTADMLSATTPVTSDEVIEMAGADMGEYLEFLEEDADFSPEDQDDAEALLSFLDGEGLVVRGNSYNSSFWGPTYEYAWLDGAEPWDDTIVWVSSHNGGDVRGNYGAWDMGKGVWASLPEADWNIMMHVETESDGVFDFSNDDPEAYYWLEDGQNPRNLEEIALDFDWEDKEEGEESPFEKALF